MFSALILHSFNLGAAHKPFHVRENVPGVFYMENSQCTYVSISIYTSYFCFAVCIIANICVCVFVCENLCVCVFLCVYVFLCALQAVKNVCVEEREEAEKRWKSETASKQPAVATTTVSLPAFLLYFSACA